MMKKAALFLLAGGMVLSGCGYDAGFGGNGVIYNEAGVGVSVDDSKSTETATRTTDDKGKETWAKTSGEGVTFTFMTRPGADAAYIKGYRVTSLKLNGREKIATPIESKKMNLYLTSGYICSERTALRSCVAGADGTVIGNGVPAKANISLEGGLADVVEVEKQSVRQVTTIEFFGFTANGTPFTVTAKGVLSHGIKLGD